MAPTRRWLPIGLALVLGPAAALAGCGPAAKVVPTPDRPSPKATATAPRNPVVPPGTGPTAPLISNKGGGLVAHDGGALTGSARIPAGIVANNGSALISNKGGGIVATSGGALISNKGGGFRLAAGGDAPLVGFPVTIVDARGEAVRDAAGVPYATTTDAAGAYRFARAPRGANLVVRVALPAEVGEMLAFLPDAAAGAAREAAVDAASTLELGYVLEKFVRVQADPVAALQKLTPAAEAAARASAAAALAAGAPLTSFRPEPLLAAAEALRAQHAAFDQELERVHQLLAGGLADVGDGALATQVPLTSPIGLARLPDGALLVAERNGHRIRRIDAQTGVVTTFAGKNGGTEAGDGGPATDAFIDKPVAIAADRRGNVYVFTFGRDALRRIDAATGVIDTIAGGGPTPARDGLAAREASLGQPFTVAVDAQDRPVFVTGTGIWRLEADGRLKAIAGPAGVGGTRMIAAGPDGSLQAFFHEQGVVAKLTGDALVPVPGAARLPVGGTRFGVGEARFAVGADGRVYALEGDKVWALAPGGEWAQVPFTTPHGELWCVLPEADHLLLCDGERNRVWRLPLAGGEGTIVAGLAAMTADEVAADALTLNRPTTLLLDARGDLLVADALNNVIWRREADGRYTRWAGGVPAVPGDTAIGDGGPARDAKLLTVFGLTLLADGTVLIGEATPPDFRIRAVAPDGTITTRALPEGTGAPAFLAEEAGGTMLASDYLNRKLWRWKDGKATEAVPPGSLVQPGQILVRPDGSFLVADVEGNTIYRVVDGVPTKIAGGNGPGFEGDGGPATAAKLNNPVTMVFGPDGDLYISDLLNDRVRRVRMATGIIETVAGAGGKLLAGATPDDSLKEPTGLAFDRDGNLYVADSGHNQVKVLSASQLR